ncbi:PREDICTED: voltage-dependent calcium channel subunit alpha-2/delta-3-like [Priapulus caudatus]|uniref:Voltage-dependent calcium channel subunit alpha-2/delta-3-like n=1 Tax=Priapulus caudatus TaxID=37621 RepID=A0ABM1EJC4_PRICU|nr:PREDICTED: voltage-dependent calcium channel subunit alpha-2/delta-3-like [Priapulus caudatus]
MMTSVAQPVFDRKNSSKKLGNLLGVMGTDVPLKELTKLTPPFQIGPNGYSFAITNNGYVLFHPDLRPIYGDGKTKPNYNSVDLAEVEIPDSDDIPHTTDISWTWRRWRYLTLTIYHLLLTYYGDGKTKPNYNSVDLAEVEIPDSDELDGPDYAMLLRRDMIDRGSKEGSTTMKVRVHFDNMRRVTVRNNSYTYRGLKDTPFTLGLSLPMPYGVYHVTGIIDATDPVLTDELYHEMFHSEYNEGAWRVANDWVYCILGGPGDEVPGNNEEALLFYIDIGRHSNVTMKAKYKEKCERFIERSKQTVEEVYYKRAVDHGKDQLVVSVPFDVRERSYDSFDNDNDTVMTISSPVVVTTRDEDMLPAVSAVVGMQIKHSSVVSEFYRIVNNTHHQDEKWTCRNDDMQCYVLDDNAFVVISEDFDDTGMFFGDIEPRLLDHLVRLGVYIKVPMYDFQGMCQRQNNTTDSASTMLTPWRSLSYLLTWLWKEIGLFLAQYSMYNLWYGDHGQTAKETRVTAARVSTTNLVMVAHDVNCICTPPDHDVSIAPNEMRHDDDMCSYLRKQIYRKKPDTCASYNENLGGVGMGAEREKTGNLAFCKKFPFHFEVLQSLEHIKLQIYN